MVDQLQGAWYRLMSFASLHRTDGFLTEAAALQECRGRRALLERFFARPLADRAPLLHRTGDDCPCLEGEAWREGYDVRIHRFLKRNPSRAENERHRAQTADSRDHRLRQLVFARDGGCCRYCRSGPLARKGMGRARDRRRAISYDHVDPDQAAGSDAANYVVSCARCNELKGHRTPAEADLVLLPAPSPEDAARMLAAPEALHDLPPTGSSPLGETGPLDDVEDARNAVDGPVSRALDGPADNAATTDTTTHTTTNSVVDARCRGGCRAGCPHHPEDVPAGHHQALPLGQDCLQSPRQPTGQRTSEASGGSGSGRGGAAAVRPVPGPPRSPPAGPPRGRADDGQPARDPADPDVYHRRSRPRGGDP